MTIQYSIQQTVSDGTLNTITLGIQYLQRNDIYLRIDGEETPQSGAPSGYTWSFLDNTTLKIMPVVPVGISVVIYRRTDINSMYNVYSQNAQFDEATIDENNQQLLYIAQEYLEQGIPGAGVASVEFLREENALLYYRFKLTDGGYTPEFTVPAGDTVLRNELITNNGANLVGFSPTSQYNPASVGFRLKSVTYVTDAPYNADPNGIVPFRQSIQNAIDAVHSAGGGVVVIPTGNFLMDATPITPRSNVRVLGFGATSKIVVNTDMRVFEYIAPSVSSVLFGFELEGVFIDNTVTSARTKYDIYIENPNFCRFTKVHIKSGHIDTQYSDTNVGGVHLTKSLGSTTTAFCNWFDDCWMQNNSIWFDNLTDSRIKGGYVWGHTRKFAIRITGGGANAVESVMGIIPSKYNGGIWLDGIGLNQMRIINNEFDGNPLLDTGAGIYAPQQVITLTAIGNTFWGCDKQGIHVVDPIGWSVTGNNFWKCNAADAGYDDILVEGKTFSPNGNTFSGNTHVIDDARVNKGRAYRELNSGFAPTLNTVTDCGITGSYLTPAIFASGIPGQETTIDNCVGGGMDTVTQKPNTARNRYSQLKSVIGIVPAGRTLDLVVNTEVQFGVVGGFSGVLSISTVRQNFTAQGTTEVLGVAARGLTLAKSVIATVGGPSGGSSYTLTVPNSGTIRFTNTSSEVCDVRLSFDGVTALV